VFNLFSLKSLTEFPGFLDTDTS